MSEHTIDLTWARNGGPFERGKYDRDHSVRFEGGQLIRNSSAVDFGGAADASNPEELLLAALSSCHMLTFLAVAANRGYIVDRYEDHATALLDKNADGKMAVTHATLAPKVQFGGDKQPSPEDYAKMQERAHAGCFIANSVKTVVEVRV